MHVVPHALEGCRAKLQRATEQVQYLDTEITSLLNSGAYSVVGTDEFPRSRYAFRTLGPPVPLRFSVLIGEIVHHLWSIFDHIVWALASKEGKPDHERIAFPVKATAVQFQKAVAGGMLKGVPREALTLIESLQPYRTPNPATAITRILHDLDNADKHRLLVAAVHATIPGSTLQMGSQSANVSIILPRDDRFGIFNRTIEDGVEVHWIAYQADTDPRLVMKNDFSVHVAFESLGIFEREPVLPVLRQLCRAVEGVVNEFGQFF